jgi:hypothetical protein
MIAEVKLQWWLEVRRAVFASRDVAIRLVLSRLCDSLPDRATVSTDRHPR